MHDKIKGDIYPAHSTKIFQNAIFYSFSTIIFISIYINNNCFISSKYNIYKNIVTSKSLQRQEIVFLFKIDKENISYNNQ